MFKSESIVLCAVILLAAGCDPAGKPAPTASGGKSLTVGMLPKLIGIPYFNACRKGAQEAAKELGVNLVFDGPDTADVVKQSELVNAWIHRQFDVVAVAPNNPEAIAPVLTKARERGIHVITWDTDAAPAAREFFLNQVDYRLLAEKLVDIVSEEIGGSGRVALISGTETAANQNAWMALMREYAARKHPTVTFIDPPEYPAEDDARAYQSAQGLLKRPDPPAALIGMTSVSAPAAAKAVFDAKLAGKVAVTGITLPSSMRQYVKNGTVKRFVLWNPTDLGYLTVFAARRLAEGALKDGVVDAGKLGKLKLKDGQVVLGPPLVFDAGNIDKYDF